MEYARALALGGRIIYANQSLLKIVHTNTLKPRCAFCGEPVFYKHGFKKIPHFSHYPDIPTRKLEECILRQKSDSYSYSGRYLTSYSGRGQRLKIFQKSLLDIFSEGNKDFKAINEKLNAESYYSDFGELTYAFVRDLISNTETCILASKIIYRDESIDRSTLREQILCEAVDYLTVLSSRSILKSIIQYNWYILSRKNSDSTYSDIIHETCQSIAKAPWLETFEWVNHQYEIMSSLGIPARIPAISSKNQTQNERQKSEQSIPIRGGNKRIDIELSSNEYHFGCEKAIEFKRLVICKKCKGLGSFTKKDELSQACNDCHSRGRIMQQENLEIIIPPASKKGRYERLNLKEYGNEGTRIDGNLVIHIKLKSQRI
ncbi:hypothetical protein [Trichocoleus sp. FACHB-262]|uniref:competence protein CoiA family protein n=1 Tax=Trichocoleus sp. FACHB-262 TaxID=2692869 RepID=UPI0016833204|nr:hypothetical protein [Trichocoleus sp. FACHB-262]MBD2123608.1 hypothetical protein [Trichocoleus sp. FACHB-262]